MEGMLSQDEINALLNGMSTGDEQESNVDDTPQELLTDEEKDAIGEIANISMGTSATTLFSLVNRKVNITTPVVKMSRWSQVIDEYERPCVFIQIKYTIGLDGANILVLKEHDVKVITDLMMGGDGTNTEGELGELHLSAISEAMNQMMGSAATSLSSMLGKKIDISPPEASLVNLMEFKQPGEIASFLEEDFVKISFSMQIDDLVDSTIIQLYPVEFAKSLYETFMGTQEDPAPVAAEPYIPPKAEPQPQQPAMEMPQMGMAQQPMMGMPQSQVEMPQMGMPQMGMPQPQMMNGMGVAQQPMMGIPQPQMGMPQMQQPVNIQPVQFQSFGSMTAMNSQENIGLIMDVPLDVTVELGRTKKSIAEILDFAPGTIIELDKIAGEPIDVLVNGKYVAKGEVVVIEESFGIRVTEIIK